MPTLFSMYSGRSRSKSPMVSKRRRGSKSPMRGIVTGRGEYGYQQMFNDLIGDTSEIPFAGEAIKLAESNTAIADEALKKYRAGPGTGVYNGFDFTGPFRNLRGRAGVLSAASASNPIYLNSSNSVRPTPVPAIASVAGRGMYTPMLQLGGAARANSLVKGGRSPLQFGGTRDENGSLIMSFSEFVRDVSAPTSGKFVVQSFGLNPGLAEAFPLLSQFAQNFEEYEFQQLIVEYRTSIDASSVATSTGNPGSVILCTNYNADADVFGDKEQMLLYSGGVESRITESCIHGVECDRHKLSGSPTKLVRASNLPVGDYKDYDKGLFQIAFNNLPSTFQGIQIGSLYMHYTVRLSKPKLFAALSNNVQSVRYYGTAGLSATNLVGSNLCTALKSTIRGVTMTHENRSPMHGIRWTFPDHLSGVFDIYFAMEGSGIVYTGGTQAWVVNDVAVSATNQPRIAFYEDLGAGGAIGTSPAGYCYSGTSVNYMQRLRVKVTATPVAGSNWVACAFTSAATTVTSVYSEVVEQASNFQVSPTVAFPLWVNANGVVVSP